MKKSTFLLGTLFLFTNLFSQATWVQVSSPVNENFVSVCFTDNQSGWILSDEGTLLFTSDEGYTWQTSTPVGSTCSSMFFSDAGHGCLVGWQDSSFIYTTDDGGATWVNRYHTRAQRLNDVFFIDNNTGWTAGIKDDKNYNLYTSDGGETWTPQMDIFVLEGELYSISFRDSNSGTTCGADGVFLITNSGGTNGWALDISIPQLGVDLNDVFNWGSQTGCAVGENGTALFTTNQWYQFIETNTNTNTTLNAVSADEATNKLWAAGENGLIIYSPNYLLGWATQVTGVTENLNDIQMLDELNGWAVGENGTILHYTTGSSVGETALSYCTVFPNPALEKVYIDDLPANTEKHVALYGLTGKVLLANLVGKNETTSQLDVQNVQPGIYLLRISTSGEVITRKITIY